MGKKSKIWHPMTQHGLFGDMISVEWAEGAYLYTTDGRQIIDGISSWWVNTHGHCHPHIVRAVQEQAGKLEQVIFAGFTHPTAEKLTEKLLSVVHEKLGDRLQYAFYSDSGSTAIEVALKMAIGAHAQKGRMRTKIVALDGGYHGDTFGAMAAGERGVFNEMYAPFLFEVIHLPFPHKGKEQATIDAYQAVLDENPDNVAAFIFEPIVQGAAGMRIYSAETLKNLAEMSWAHGVYTIADEVMTGFGRTGTFFGCEHADFSPDLMCLSKGLTGGYLPMGLTLASAPIYQAFYHDDRAKQFFHSTSFTGNALACAAALASLEIWEQENTAEKLEQLNTHHNANIERVLQKFQQDQAVKDIRSIGTIVAFDVVDQTEGYLSSLGTYLYDQFLCRDVLLRPIGNTVYILPPYCITKEDLERIYDTIEQSLDRLRYERGE